LTIIITFFTLLVSTFHCMFIVCTGCGLSTTNKDYDEDDGTVSYDAE